jgi:hypothetical protein
MRGLNRACRNGAANGGQEGAGQERGMQWITVDHSLSSFPALSWAFGRLPFVISGCNSPRPESILYHKAKTGLPNKIRHG